MLICQAAAATVAVSAAAAVAVAEGRAEEVRRAGGRWGERAKKKQGGAEKRAGTGWGGAQVRVARNDSGAGAGRGKVSAENWRVKEFKRREQNNKNEKKRLSYKTNSRSPASGGCYVNNL